MWSTADGREGSKGLGVALGLGFMNMSVGYGEQCVLEEPTIVNSHVLRRALYLEVEGQMR